MTNYEKLKSGTVEDLAHTIVRLANGDFFGLCFRLGPYKFRTYDAAVETCVKWLNEEAKGK